MKIIDSQKYGAVELGMKTQIKVTFLFYHHDLKSSSSRTNKVFVLLREHF